MAASQEPDGRPMPPADEEFDPLVDAAASSLASGVEVFPIGSETPDSTCSPDASTSCMHFGSMDETDDVSPQHDMSDDWYALDDGEINSRLEQELAESPPRSSALSSQLPSDGSPESSLASASSAAPAPALSASKLWKKVGKFTNTTKSVLMTEAKLLAADARDFTDGVREGARLTAQDTQSLKEHMASTSSSSTAPAGAASSGGGGGSRWGFLAGGGANVRGLFAAAAPSAPDSATGGAATSTGPAVASAPEVGALATDSTICQASVASTDAALSSGDGGGAVSCAGHERSDRNTDFPAGGSSSSEVPIVSSQKAPSAFRALRKGLGQGLAATAEVSSQMWRDIKEVKEEAVSVTVDELRLSVQDLRHGVRGLVQGATETLDRATDKAHNDTSLTREEKAQGSAQEVSGESHAAASAGVPGDDQASLVGGADAEAPEGPEAVSVSCSATPSVASPTEALDMLLRGDGDDSDGFLIVNSAADERLDERSQSERLYDEHTEKAVQKVQEVARATAAGSKKLWKKTESSIKKGLTAVPIEGGVWGSVGEVFGDAWGSSSVSTSAAASDSSCVVEGSCAPFAPALRVAQQPGADSEDGGQTPSPFWELPSARANYAELVLGDGEGFEDAASSQQQDAKKAAQAAVKGARKLGGRLAKKMTSGFRDLGQNMSTASASAGAAIQEIATRVGPTDSVATHGGGGISPGDEACDDDSIFEIGDSDESDGDGDAWSDRDGTSVDNLGKSGGENTVAPIPCSSAPEEPLKPTLNTALSTDSDALADVFGDADKDLEDLLNTPPGTPQGASCAPATNPSSSLPPASPQDAAPAAAAPGVAHSDALADVFGSVDKELDDLLGD